MPSRHQQGQGGECKEHIIVTDIFRLGNIFEILKKFEGEGEIGCASGKVWEEGREKNRWKEII